MKTILWVPFFAPKISRPLVPAFPGAIGRFALPRAILPLKIGRRIRDKRLEPLVNKGFGGGWGYLGPEGEGEEKGGQREGL